MADPNVTSASRPRQAIAEIKLSEGGIALQGRVGVSTGPTTLSEMLPLARAMCDGIVKETVRVVAESGKRISCGPGCGACCSMLVPVAEVEARRLRDVVEAMPEPRRGEIRERFRNAIEKMTAAGLANQLRKTDQLSHDEYQQLTKAYFAQRVPCPFLENESCSIYEERPISCREYLVTSPAELCGHLEDAAIEKVRIPLPLFSAVAQWQVPRGQQVNERWVPLIYALWFAERQPNNPPPVAGTELLRELLEHITGRKQPSAMPSDPTNLASQDQS